MNLLGSALYDPAGAVSKVTTSLLAMTALDTTNLRVAVTVPAHGRLFFRLSGVHHGSTTTAQLFLGVLNGSTVLGRQPAQKNLLGTAIATTQVRLDAEFAVSGLTPGSMNCDAAYGVEIVSSAGGAIKYGGPNNTTTNDAFGGFSLQVWDPSPAVAYAAEVRTNLTTELGRIDEAVSTRSTYAGGDTAGTTTLLSRIASTLTITTGKVDVNDKTGFSLSAGGVQAIWDALTSALTTVGSIGKWILDKLDAAITSRLASASYSAPPSAATNATAVRSELTAELANLDAAVSTRLATAGYTTPPTAAANASQVRTELAVELAQITLAKKLLKNRTETNPATGAMTVYDDDGVTPLYTAAIYADVAGATPYDGTAGVNRRNALS